MKRNQLILSIALLFFSTGYAQQSKVSPITHVDFACPSGITVTYDLNSSQPVDSVTLYYSPNKCDWLFAKTVTGDHYNQAPGTGKILFWDNFVDNVRWGKFYFKVEAPDKLPTEPPSNWSDMQYVGTFHRNSETGERIIYSGHTGAWMVTITDDPGGFIIIDDGSSDPTLSSRLETMYVADTWVDPERYKVTNNTSPVSGDGNILFRVGMASENNTGAPRYGRIQVNSTVSGSPHYIYVRQGEQADNISGDYADVKWIPYNLGNYNNPSQYGNGGFVDYPTKAGYIYQWGYSTTDDTPRPYPPQGSTLSPPWSDIFAGALYTLSSVCPTGYKVPAAPDELVSCVIGTNSVWGYYADGFFDHRMIEATAEGSFGGANAVVSKGNDDVAYCGRLVFNSNTHTSIFFPAAGQRIYTDWFYGSAGMLNAAGTLGEYWSSTMDSSIFGFYLGFGNSYFSISNAGYRAMGSSVRCIAE